MTIAEFLDRLRTSGAGWHVAQGDRIFDRYEWPLGAPDDMPGATRDRIHDAADNLEGHDPTLRAALLDACDLQERP